MMTPSEVCLALIDSTSETVTLERELRLVPYEDIAKLGLVRSAATIDEAGNAISGGLFCTEIFGDGPAISNATNADGPEPYLHPRANTWGRIDLAVPMIHPRALVNMYDDLVERTQIPPDDLRVILRRPTPEGRARLRTTHDRDDVKPLVLRSLLVLPPYLRDGTHGGTADLGELYRQLVELNARLLERGSPDLVSGEEEIALFRAVEAVLVNDTNVTAADRHTLPSLIMMWEPRPMAALAAQERGEPLTRQTQMKLACIRAFGIELHVPGGASPAITLGVPL